MRDDDGFVWAASRTGVLRVATDDYQLYSLPFTTTDVMQIKRWLSKAFPFLFPLDDEREQKDGQKKPAAERQEVSLHLITDGLDNSSAEEDRAEFNEKLETLEKKGWKIMKEKEI